MKLVTRCDFLAASSAPPGGYRLCPLFMVVRAPFFPVRQGTQTADFPAARRHADLIHMRRGSTAHTARF